MFETVDLPVAMLPVRPSNNIANCYDVLIQCVVMSSNQFVVNAFKLFLDLGICMFQSGRNA